MELGRYKAAGVDIDAGNEAVRRLRETVRSTLGAEVLENWGGFAGLLAFPGEHLEDPVLVATADGVGTKLKVAILMGRHQTIGEDLVNHSVNDLLTTGARPLFFLDYIAMGRLDPGRVEELVSGMARACRVHGCSLLGGETAEMPGLYQPGDYDLAGFMVGVVERRALLGPARVREGDLLLGLPSSGLHTNGYSLARQVIFHDLGLRPHDPVPYDPARTVGEMLLDVHRSYYRLLYPRIKEGNIRALAHITGGGLPENVPRVIPAGCKARIYLDRWEVPPLFRWLQEAGRIPGEESYRILNMGVGMVVIVGREGIQEEEAHLKRGGEVYRLGEVVAGEGGVEFVPV